MAVADELGGESTKYAEKVNTSFKFVIYCLYFMSYYAYNKTLDFDWYVITKKFLA